MKKNYFDFSIVLLAGIIFYFLFSQCYTTFQHPVVYVPVDSTTYYEQEVTFADDCSQCHEQEKEYKEYVENTTDIYADPVYQQDYNWNYYFVTPWWYDPYYYYGDNQTVENADQLAPTQRRDFDRRDTPPGPNYAAPAASSPSSLSKSRSSDPPNRSSSASQPKRAPRRSTISNPTPHSQPSAPGPKRVSRTKSGEKSKKKKNE